MHFKTFDNRRLFLKMIKNNFKLELRNCYIYHKLLYISERLYVLNVFELRIKIIKNIHDTLFKNHVE